MRVAQASRYAKFNAEVDRDAVLGAIEDKIRTVEQLLAQRPLGMLKARARVG
jgi:hypothetical protein